jgi:lysyl-tRNA synthetase class 2
LAALTLIIIGVANLIWALSPHGSWLNDVLPGIEPFRSTPIFGSFAIPAAVALVVAGAQLGRRHQLAWALTLALLLALGLLKLFARPDFLEASLSFVAAALLWSGRRAFHVRLDLRALRGALATVASLAAGCSALVLVAALAILHTEPRIAAQEGVALLSWHPGPVPLGDEAGGLPLMVKTATLLLLVASAYLAFRVRVSATAPSADELNTARRVVQRHGRDTLAFFKLRRDTQRLFTADHSGFLAYRIRAGVLIVSGDPVGPPHALPELVRRAAALADERGLRLAVLGASQQLLALYRQAGLRPLYLGDEAIVETSSFTLEGRAIRKVRQSVSRLERAGYCVTLRPLGSLSRQELEELESVSNAWRRGRPERGFSMALDALDRDAHADTTVALAQDEAGMIQAFLHLVPSYGRAALSLSAMRRRPTTPNGLTEFLVARTIAELRSRGIGELSLNFAAFARLLQAPGNRRERVFGRVIALLNPYFQIDSLYQFNAKFFPRWEPRYLLYDGVRSLPRTGLAALLAEGQLAVPDRPRRPRLATQPATARLAR